jgi:hypothetical protein
MQVAGSRLEFIPAGTAGGLPHTTVRLVNVPDQQAALTAVSEGFCPSCPGASLGGDTRTWCPSCLVYWRTWSPRE